MKTNTRSSPGQKEKIVCKSCQESFRGKRAFKQHFHSDWHRYNFKRNLISLSPITEGNFERRRLELSEKKNRSIAEKETVKIYRCGVCSKKFKSLKTKAHHDQSRKHLKNVTKQKKVEGFRKKSGGERVEVGQSEREGTGQGTEGGCYIRIGQGKY